MNKMLLVIDLQNDFISDSNRFIINKIDNLINSDLYDKIVFTKFINSSNNFTYKKLNYTSCLTKKGQDIPIDTKNHFIIEKSKYSALNNDLIEYIQKHNILEIDICGIDTECCVLKTAFDLFENNYNVKVLRNYCASFISKDRHDNAISILERNIGKNNVIDL